MAVGRFDIFTIFIIIVFASFTVIGWVDFFVGFVVVRLVFVSSTFGIVGRVGVSALFLIGRTGDFTVWYTCTIRY